MSAPTVDEMPYRYWVSYVFEGTGVAPGFGSVTVGRTRPLSDSAEVRNMAEYIRTELVSPVPRVLAVLSWQGFDDADRLPDVDVADVLQRLWADAPTATDSRPDAPSPTLVGYRLALMDLGRSFGIDFDTITSPGGA